MQIIINFIIFLITLFVYIHINFHLKVTNDLEIYEADELTKDKLEEICDIKQPLLFKYYVDVIHNEYKMENILSNYKTFDINIRNQEDYKNSDINILPLSLKESKELFDKDMSGSYISEFNGDFISETTLVKNNKSNDLFLRPYLCSDCNYDIILGSTNSYTPLKYELNYRNFLYVIEGEAEIMITIPQNVKYLDIIEDYDNFEFRSRLNPFNISDTDKLEKVKFLTVILKPGDILYIPFKWLYTIRLKTKDTVLCKHNYKVVMNTLAILPQLIYNFLHNQNIKFNFLNTIK